MTIIQDENIEWSKIYDGGRDFTLITSQALDRILTFVNNSLPKSNLDLGCGTGQLTRELYHRGYECTGLDIANSAITRAKNATIYSELQYFQFDIEDDLNELDAVRGNKFSLITTKLVYAFIKDKKAFLAKVAELIADGGIFVIITPEVKTTTPEKREIAIIYNETFELLKSVFTIVETFESNNLTYFVCKKPLNQKVHTLTDNMSLA